jgi:hypothetical protein
MAAGARPRDARLCTIWVAASVDTPTLRSAPGDPRSATFTLTANME